MIIYQSTREGFVRDAFFKDIEEEVGRQYLLRTGQRPLSGELRAWRESLLQMAKVLNDPVVPPDAGVAIEYRIPPTAKRVDFIVTGHDDAVAGTPTAVIVELKQWSTSRRTDKDAIVIAHRGGRALECEGTHPSYQAWSYAALLQDFNTTVYEERVQLAPCAYLHNHPRDGEIDHPFYDDCVRKAPLFLKGEDEREQLRAFVARHVRRGDRGALLYRIENGRIKPSRAFADSLAALMDGNPVFTLVDDQKVVFEQVLRSVANAAQRREVVIVEGGPGTGKTVVAFNLLRRLLSSSLNARYVTKNAAPRVVYEERLTGSAKRSRYGNLLTSSGAYTKPLHEPFDALIVDEAHRLNERSGLYGNLGEHQVKELIQAARCTVFFVDDHQRVTLKDVGTRREIEQWARRLGAKVTSLELASQFRCNGSDGYLAWLDHRLGIRATANETLTPAEFDFRVVDSPAELHAMIEADERTGKRTARVVAGYCWNWNSKKHPDAWDIEFPDFDYRRRWNLDVGPGGAARWMIAEGGVEQVGCVHTCQGLEVDTIGVLIGPDLAVEDGRLVTRPERRAKTDASLKGLKKAMAVDPEAAQAQADEIVRNTYRVLMTRGMKACYVWCTDPAVADHFRAGLRALQEQPAPQATSRTDALHAVAPEPSAATTPLPLRRLARHEALGQGVNAVPLVDLRFAAGAFESSSSLFEVDEWIVLPEHFAARPGHFVARVVGESMNRRIRNGALCLFRAQPAGTRNGKVVVARRAGLDPDYGGAYTVKIYRSERQPLDDGSWHHTRIELHPDSTDPTYRPIVLEGEDAEAYAIVAEFLAEIEA